MPFDIDLGHRIRVLRGSRVVNQREIDGLARISKIEGKDIADIPGQGGRRREEAEHDIRVDSLGQVGSGMGPHPGKAISRCIAHVRHGGRDRTRFRASHPAPNPETGRDGQQ
jgi:hypothetical protein